MTDRGRKALAALLIVVATAAADQVSKYLARAGLDGKPAVVLVNGMLVLHYVENEGAFLSLGAQLPRAARMAAFIAFPVLILAWLVVSVLRRQGIGWGMLCGFSLLIGGGSGNLADRVFHAGRVGDFLMVGTGGLRTGIFNLADTAVMAGCLVLLLAPSRARGKPAGSSPTDPPSPPPGT